MFDHFTFGVQPQARYLQDEVSASPTDISFITKSKQNSSTPPKEYPFPDLPAIDEIVDRFTDYTLRPKESNSAATQPTSRADATAEPSATFDYTTMSFVSTRKGLIDVVRNTSASIPSPTSHSSFSSSSSSSGSDVGCRRLQRQLNTQLQTCTNHVKDITSLVENMISTSSQCRLHSPSSLQSNRSRSSSPSHIIGSSIDDLIVDEEMSDGDGFTAHVPVVVDPNEDEGFAEMDDDDDDLEITLRRASTPIGIRKYGSAHSPVFSKYGSTGAGLNTYMPREKHKIRAVPRLRRRKPLNIATEE